MSGHKEDYSQVVIAGVHQLHNDLSTYVHTDMEQEIINS